jgi:hypothetical protein
MGVRTYYSRVTPAELEEMRTRREAMERFLQDDSADYVSVSLEKAWDALHFLLDPDRRRTWEGHRHPTNILGRAVLGGEIANPAYSASEEDHPTRFLTVTEVASAARSLIHIGSDDLRGAMDDLTAMNHHPDPKMRIYGSLTGLHHGSRKWGLSVKFEDDKFEGYWTLFKTLRDFYAEAAKAEDAVVVEKC